MGMDVYGKGQDQFGQKPWFRATIWSWRPIICLIEKTGYEVPKSWSFNDGSGLDTHKECVELADLIDDYIEGMDPYDEIEMESDLSVDEHGVFVDGPGKTPYRTTISHVREFTKFLRESGGFEIF